VLRSDLEAIAFSKAYITPTFVTPRQFLLNDGRSERLFVDRVPELEQLRDRAQAQGCTGPGSLDSFPS
jgi:hypothetical protein